MEPRSPTLQADSLPADSAGKPKNTETGSLFLLQWILPTQESNQGLLHYRWILYQLATRVSQVRKTNIIWCNLHVESKIWYKWTYLQNRNRLTDMKSKEKGDELGLADTNCYSWTFKLQTFKVGNMHLVSARNQNLCRHPQVWVKLRLALHLLLLMILQLYHLSHPLLPPVYSSSCLSTLCQPLYSQLLYCTSILFKAL